MPTPEELAENDYTVPNTENPVETLARAFPNDPVAQDNLTLWEQQQVNNGQSPTTNINTSVAPTASTAPLSSNINQQAVPSILNNSALAQQAQSGTTGANQISEAAGVSKYLNQDYVSPDYTTEDFFPGKGMPIRVGGYTGKTIGSVDFFAPTGQYVPYNIIAKREAALDKARAARKERQAKYKDPTAIAVVSPKYNENFQRAYLDGVNKIKDKAKSFYKEFYIDALQDPTSDVYKEMQQHQANYNYLGANANELINNAATVIKAVEDGDNTTYSKGQIEAARSITNSDQYGYDVNKLVQNGKKLEGYNSIEDALLKRKYFEHLKESITSSILLGQDYLTETQVKSYRDQVQKQAETMKRDLYSANPEVTVDMIKETIYAKVPELGQTTKSAKMKSVPAITAKQEIEKEAALQRAKDVDAVAFNPFDKRGNVTDATKNVLGRIKNKSTDYGTIQNAEIQKANKFNILKDFHTNIVSMSKRNINDEEGYEDYSASIDRFFKENEEKHGITLTKAGMSFDKKKPDVVRIYKVSDKDKYKDVNINDSDAVQNALIEYNYGKNAVETKGKDVVKIDYLDANKRVQSRYLKVKDPGTASEINGYLNEGTSEDQQIADPLVQKEAQVNNLLNYKTDSAKTPAAKTVDNSYVKNLSPADKKNYDQAKASGKYTEQELKDYFSK